MTQHLLFFLHQHHEFSVFISLFFSILISIIGIIPIIFVTIANIIYFGFIEGTILNIVGEVLGAIIAFYLYRKGFKTKANKHFEKHPKIKKILSLSGKEAFFSLLTLRIIPFAHSGLVTLASSLSNMSMWIFTLATLIGKIPTVILESYSIHKVSHLNSDLKIMITILCIILTIGYFLYQNHKLKNSSHS